MGEFRVPGQDVSEGVAGANLPTEITVWSKIKSFLFQDIVVELTPKQTQFENRMNEVLNQDITFKKIHDFLFQEIKFGK